MSIRDFFQTIQWGPTLQIAAIRIGIASIVWSLFFLIFGNTTVAEFFPQLFTMFVLITVFVGIAIPASGLSRAGTPFVGLATFPAWLVVVADPFVKILHTKRPDLVPVESFNFFNPPVLGVFGAADSSQSKDSTKKAKVQIVPDPPKPVDREPSSTTQDVSAFDTGSPEERYARASQFWNSKDPSAQSTAIKIWQRMTSEGVPYAKPYLVYGNYLSAVDPRGNCDEVVELRRRLVAIEPENIKFKNYLAGSLFLEGKLLWDDGNNSAAFESYIEGLHHFLDTGQVMNKAAPVTARIAFCACRMFSKQALERDSNADLGVRFFDWCERAGIDANEDIDISDARTK